MATVFTENAEAGTDTATPAASTTTNFGIITSPTGLTFSATQKKAGALSFHVAGTSINPQPTAILGSALAQAYSRHYVYPTANPATSTIIMSCKNNANTLKPGDLRVNGDGTVTVRDNISSTIVSTGTSLALNAWNRIEWGVHPAASGSYQYLRLFVGSNVDGLTPDFEDLTGTCSSAGATDVGRFVYGITASNTWDYYFDEIVVDDTTWAGPIVPASSFFFNHTVTVG